MGVRARSARAAMMAALSLVLPVVASGQTPRAGVVTTLQGTATVARATAPRPMPLRFRDDVFVRDRISTGAASIARILLGGKAVVTIRERSQLTITETATTSTIEMTSGTIALSVNKDRVKPGESVDIRTPNAVAAIRGTIIVAEVDPPGTGGTQVSTRFTLLTGVVDVTGIDPATGRGAGPVVVLKPLQTLGVTGFGALGAPRPITRAEADIVAARFAVPLRESWTGANAKLVDDQVQEAARRSPSPPGDLNSDKPGRESGKDGGRGPGPCGPGDRRRSQGQGPPAKGPSALILPV
jgi:FecR protein